MICDNNYKPTTLTLLKQLHNSSSYLHQYSHKSRCITTHRAVQQRDATAGDSIGLHVISVHIGGSIQNSQYLFHNIEGLRVMTIKNVVNVKYSVS